MKAGCLRILWALAFLSVGSCFAQQSNHLVHIEGTTQESDGSVMPGAYILLSNGTSVVSNKYGHYFAVLPSGFTGSSIPTLTGVDFSPASRTLESVRRCRRNSCAWYDP